MYGFLGGYEDWLYAVSAVWAFDRFARITRILITGICRAKVTELGDGLDYVRIDISGVRWSTEPGKHAYFYFPTLRPLTPWENHPFSVMPTVLLRPSRDHGKFDSSSLKDHRSMDQAESSSDMEKRTAVTPRTTVVQDQPPSVGLTLFIRKGTGMLKTLQAQNDLLTLVEGPYPNNSTGQVLRCDRLLLIGGGIGITGLVPFIVNHWNVRLCWSVKESAKCLVDELDGVLAAVADKEVVIGHRLNVDKLLAQEVETGWAQVGVIVSGPGGLCDNVRAAVAVAAKQGRKTVFELEVEAYSW